MTAISLSTSTHIRRIDLRRDLRAVADLIEICFANTMDEDGREYLRSLRWSARDFTSLAWLQGAAERIASPLFGFVWEESGHIIGNLSLIPLNRRGQLAYMIANVAVHPDYRQQGIGRQLTQTAMDHLKQRGLSDVWLQVRDDNPVAYHLYRSLGFVERARRTTWLGRAALSLPPLCSSGLSLTHRHGHDWERQVEWLRRTYPADIAWNLPLSLLRLDPNPIQQFLRWLQGEKQEHWVARRGSRPVGFATWEPARSANDLLWLAVDPVEEEEALLCLLPHTLAAFTHRGRGLSVNYPAGQGRSAFVQTGFVNHQTLLWMQAVLNR